MNPLKFLRLALTVMAAHLAAGPAHATITVLDYWRMGEDDPGAVSGAYCTNTVDAVGGKTLTNTPVGGPHPIYTNEISVTASAETGSTLALAITNGQYLAAALATNLTDNFGIECWVNPGATSGGQVLAYNGLRGSGWGLYQGGTNFEVLYGGKIFFDIVPATAGVWTHLALVRNNGVATFYTNGVPASTNCSVVPITPTDSFTVGGDALFGEYYTGSIDEVRVFTFAAGAFSTNDLLLNSTNLFVSNATDDSAGSLRQIIAQAAPGDLISFIAALSGQTITLTSGELELTQSVTIDGSALPRGITLNGNAADRVFYVASGSTVVLTSLIVTNGTYAFDSPGEYGGGIENYGNLTINRCTITGNTAPDNYGGGIDNENVLTVNQSTLTGNSSLGGGGISTRGPLTISQSTIAGNSSTEDAGGIVNAETVTLSNSIVAGNTPYNFHNSSYTGGCNFTNANALLAPLGNYGGPTLTMPPLPGSPVMDGCTNGTSFATDQRGYPRVVGTFADIGAVEVDPIISSLADNGTNTSLRAIILGSAPGQTNTFAPGLSGGTITLTNGGLVPNVNLTIDGSGLTNRISVSGNYSSRVFQVRSSLAVTLNALTLANGSAPGGTYPANCGGGILNSGQLTLNACVLENNQAVNGLVPSGGGIENDSGTLTVSNCTFSGNSSPFGGGIDNEGVLMAFDSTFASNAANNAGGATYNGSAAADTSIAINCTFAGNSAAAGGGMANFGSLAITNCTLSGNSATTYGGGIYSDAGTLSVLNTILAGNSAPAPGQQIDVAGGTAATNYLDLNDPLLAPLGDYGGPTQTMPPLPGSPAIDAGVVVPGLATDQRGFPRVVGPAPDLGAVETGNPIPGYSPVVTVNSDGISSIGDGQVSLRAAVAFATNNSAITFASGLSGQTITLTNGNGQLVLDQKLTIDASAQTNGVTINGNHASRIFLINNGAAVTLNALVLSNGFASGDYGGAISNSPGSTAVISNCYVVACSAGIYGGGILNNGVMTVASSTLAGNSAGNYGGGLNNDGTLLVNQCTLAGNSAGTGGGGISSGGQVNLIQSTLTANTAGGSAGGIHNGGTLILSNSIVAGNSAPASADLDSAYTGVTNQVSGSVLLAGLGFYGGRTPTMPPLPGSSLIAAGSVAAAAGFATDQRGFQRIVGAHVDLGAVEVQSPAANAPVLGNIALSGGGGGGGGASTLRFAFTNAPDADFTVLTSPNVASPLTNWTVLGEVMQPAPGHYEFTDPQAGTNAVRFYRVRSP